MENFTAHPDRRKVDDTDLTPGVRGVITEWTDDQGPDPVALVRQLYEVYEAWIPHWDTERLFLRRKLIIPQLFLEAVRIVKEMKLSPQVEEYVMTQAVGQMGNTVFSQLAVILTPKDGEFKVSEAVSDAVSQVVNTVRSYYSRMMADRIHVGSSTIALRVAIFNSNNLIGDTYSSLRKIDLLEIILDHRVVDGVVSKARGTAYNPFSYSDLAVNHSKEAARGIVDKPNSYYGLGMNRSKEVAIGTADKPNSYVLDMNCYQEDVMTSPMVVADLTSLWLIPPGFGFCFIYIKEEGNGIFTIQGRKDGARTKRALGVNYHGKFPEMMPPMEVFDHEMFSSALFAPKARSSTYHLPYAESLRAPLSHPRANAPPPPDVCIDVVGENDDYYYMYQQLKENITSLKTAQAAASWVLSEPTLVIIGEAAGAALSRAIMPDSIGHTPLPKLFTDTATLTGFACTFAGIGMRHARPKLAGVMTKIGALVTALAVIVSLGTALPPVLAWPFGAAACLLVAMAVALA